jgi:predicted ester cyclase
MTRTAIGDGAGRQGVEADEAWRIANGAIPMTHGQEATVTRPILIAAALSVALGCSPKGRPMDSAELKSFGTRYTAAWCSQDAASVAAFFSESGSLQINGGAASVGRTAITAAAQGFMTAFPDMIVTMDGVDLQGDRAVYRWTLTGTNTGPGGSGKAVRISGYEEWRFGADGLIAESKGHFDEADYKRQLAADPSGS